MKKFIVLILLLAIAAPSALATSMEYPEEVFQNLFFKLQQDTTALDCTGGGTCIVNWTSPLGLDNGSFVENAGGADPDAANRFHVFSEVGTYTVYLYECPTANCTFIESETVDVVSVTTEVADLLAQLDAVNTTATSADSDLQDQIDTLAGNISNNTALIAELSANATSLQSQITDVQTNITDLQAALALTDANVTALNASIVALESRVSDLEADVATLAAAVEQLNHGRINLIYTQATDNLRVRLYFPVGATEALIQAHNAADDSVVYNVSGITPDADGAFNYDWDVSAWESHIYTIKARFDNASGDRVGRWAVEPFDTLYVLALGEWLNETSLFLNETYDELVVLNATVQNNTDRIAELESNVSDIRAELTLVQGNVSTLLNITTDLQNQIDALDARLDTVEGLLVLIDFGNLDLVWTKDTQTLRAKIKFPTAATEARLMAYDENNDLYEMVVGISPQVDQYENYDWDVSTWDIQTYTIKVGFYNSSGDSVARWVSELFDNLLLDWIADNQYGFGLMDSQTFEVWNPQDEFIRHMSWAFTSEFGGEYWFELVQFNGDNISKTFAGGTCYAVDDHNTRYFSHRNVRFPAAEGEYSVQLRAHDCNSGDVIRSNRFWIDVIDLALPLPNNTAGFSELGILQSPQTDVYYTSDGYFRFDVLMQSTTGWSPALDCIVRYDDGLGGQNLKIWDMSAPNASGVTECGGTLDVAAITADNGDGNWTLEVCAEPKEHNPSGLDELCDTLDFMYDAEAPVIIEESLNPGVLDVVAGEWTFGANITDNGEVMSVEFSLIAKDNASDICNLGAANNTEGNLWTLNYDTTGNCTPDGYYNFSVTAVDYANNSFTLAIDPLIDNTAPVVDAVLLGGFLGSNMTIDATISDNLAGVLTANATIYRYSCNDNATNATCSLGCQNKTYDTWNESVVLTKTAGTSFSGTWSGNFAQESGWSYEVVVGATDGAGNLASPVNESREARVGYTVTISTSQDPIYDNAQVAFTGTVTSSDGSMLPVNTVLVEGVAVPVTLNTFMTSAGPFGTGLRTVSAEYDPQVICNETFTGETSFSVTFPPSNGGGGGGGGFIPTSQNAVGGENEEESQESETQEDSGSNDVQTGGSNTGGSTEEPSAEEGSSEENNDNLLTGAVTGAGFFGDNWPWLALFGGLVVALFGVYFYIRR